MAENIYPCLKEAVDHIRLYNDTGAALVQYEATVIGRLPVICDEAEGIASTAVGSCHLGGMHTVWRTDSFVTAEDTFNTPNQDVFFDPVTKKFSDTSTDGYYLVGQLIAAKASTGFIEFIKFDIAVEITS